MATTDHAMGGEAPEYFKKFFVEFQEGRNEVSQIKTSLEEARKEWREETGKNNETISRNCNEINLLKAHAALADNFEVLLLGFPAGPPRHMMRPRVSYCEYLSYNRTYWIKQSIENGCPQHILALHSSQ